MKTLLAFSQIMLYGFIQISCYWFDIKINSSTHLFSTKIFKPYSFKVSNMLDIVLAYGDKIIVAIKNLDSYNFVDKTIQWIERDAMFICHNNTSVQECKIIDIRE